MNININIVTRLKRKRAFCFLRLDFLSSGKFKILITITTFISERRVIISRMHIIESLLIPHPPPLIFYPASRRVFISMNIFPI